MKTTEHPKVGQVWRDIYGDKHRLNQRTIRLVEGLEDGFRAEVLTGTDGAPAAKQRFVTLKTKTLRAGYTLLLTSPPGKPSPDLATPPNP